MCGEELEWQFNIAVAKDIIVAGASLTAATVAIIGLKTWRRQLTATANAEVSRTLLRTVYRVRNGVSIVRNPFTPSGESASAFRELEIANAATEALDFPWKVDSSIYQVHLNKLEESVSEMRSAMIEAEVLWGAETEALLEPLFQKVSQLRAAITVYLHSLKDDSRRMTVPEQEELYKILYDVGGKNVPDQFMKELNEAVKRIEDSLRKRFPYEKSL